MSKSVHAKEVVVSELLEIAPVASLGEINNIGNDRAKIQKGVLSGATAN